MKIQGFLARFSVIMAICFSQSLADSNSAIDSNKQNKKITSTPPPHLQNLQIVQVDSQVDLRDSSNLSDTHDSSDYSDSDAVYIGESVISASGYEQDIKDAPATISIIPKEELLTRPIRDLGDVVQDIPGVYVESSKTGGNTISMRGLGSAYTLILIDGKRQNVAQGYHANGFDGTNSSFMPPLSMIERIEVIRGPASTIYGSDAMGGVINIITKKNFDKVSGGFQL